jgi:hypothetical protein
VRARGGGDTLEKQGTESVVAAKRTNKEHRNNVGTSYVRREQEKKKHTTSAKMGRAHELHPFSEPVLGSAGASEQFPFHVISYFCFCLLCEMAQ